jgi:hypothetical protein
MRSKQLPYFRLNFNPMAEQILAKVFAKNNLFPRLHFSEYSDVWMSVKLDFFLAICFRVKS